MLYQCYILANYKALGTGGFVFIKVDGPSGPMYAVVDE
jgi:hypothetical protein